MGGFQRGWKKKKKKNEKEREGKEIYWGVWLGEFVEGELVGPKCFLTKLRRKLKRKH